MSGDFVSDGQRGMPLWKPIVTFGKTSFDRIKNLLEKNLAPTGADGIPKALGLWLPLSKRPPAGPSETTRQAGSSKNIKEK